VATARDRKKAQSAAFVETVRVAIEDAHAAAKTAYEEFAKTANKSKEGHILDACGTASVVVYTPSYRLREALKQLGEVTQGYQGAWTVSNFGKHVNDQSITAHEKACEAACAVLKARFPEDGRFYATSRID
jgi:hypothetical protein